MKRNFQLFVFIVLLVASAVFLANCGGGGSSGSSGSSATPSTSTSGSEMTQTQKEAFAEHASTLAIQALNNTTFAKAVYNDSATDAVSPKQALEDKLLSSVSCNQAGCSIYQPLSNTWTCAAGGRTAITGSISGNISSSGSGLIQIQLTQTITDNACYVSGLLFNGDPYLSLTGNFSFLNGQPATTQRVTISGGFKWSGSSSGSCSMNVSTNFDRNGHGTTSGTVCGSSIYQTF